MVTLPKEPVRGQYLSLQWGRELVRWLRQNRLIAGKNMSISRTVEGVRLDASGGGGRASVAEEAEELKPFSLRFHSDKNGQNTRLEVYLPAGSMTTEGDCVPLNAPAKTVAGHDKDDADWYVVEKKGGGEQYTAGNYRIVAHVMPGEHMLVRGEATTSSTADEYDKGHITAYTIASLTVASKTVDGKTVVTRTFTSQLTGARSMTNNAVKLLSANKLKYTLTKSGDAWAVTLLELVDVTFDAGGTPLRGTNVTIPAGTTSIWLCVTHSGGTYSVAGITETDAYVTHYNSDDETWQKIYEMEGRYATSDLRLVSNTMLFLR